EQQSCRKSTINGSEFHIQKMRLDTVEAARSDLKRDVQLLQVNYCSFIALGLNWRASLYKSHIANHRKELLASLNIITLVFFKNMELSRVKSVLSKTAFPLHPSLVRTHGGPTCVF